MKTYTFFVQLSVGFLCVASSVISAEVDGSSFRDLVKIDDQEVASFLSQQEVEIQNERQLEGAGEREFGERCGNRNGCSAGFECSDVTLGNRCLPNSCLEENFQGFEGVFDIDKLYENAGVTKDEVLAKLTEVRNERAFLQTDEFRKLREALQTNLEPINAAVELQRSCIEQNQNVDRQDQASTVSYIGLHFEVS
jgi:hypothetical protein